MKIKIENKIYVASKFISENLDAETSKKDNVFLKEKLESETSKKDKDFPKENLLEKSRKFLYKKQSFNKDKFLKGCEKKKQKDFFDICTYSIPLYSCILCNDTDNLEKYMFYIGNKIYDEQLICHDCFCVYEYYEYYELFVHMNK